MEIGIIGLGRMGANMARRLARGGVRIVGYDRDAAALARSPSNASSCPQRRSRARAGAGAAARHLADGAGRHATELAVEVLAAARAPATRWSTAATPSTRTRSAARRLAQHGLRYIDAGVSGGVYGLANGYCLMLGGTPVARCFEPYARMLAPAPERGWLHCGPSGAGHYVKMIHNGIEYGMMQAFAEGFALLEAQARISSSTSRRIAETWRHGSVVRSWLLDLCAEMLARRGRSRHRAGGRRLGRGPLDRARSRSNSACPRR